MASLLTRETVKIKRKDSPTGFALINKEDYDASRDELYRGAKVPQTDTPPPPKLVNGSPTIKEEELKPEVVEGVTVPKVTEEVPAVRHTTRSRRKTKI